MFIPNSTCVLYSRSTVKDVYSQHSYYPPINVQCSVITLDFKVTQTAIRSGASASRARAEEEMGLIELLFPVGTVINEGDVVQVENQVGEVMRIFPRRNVLGVLDHIQVDLRKGALPTSIIQAA